MIKEKTIIMNITNTNKGYYKNKGYDIQKDTKTIEIKINDLSINSHFKITAICELCNNETSLMYYKYLLNYNRYNFYSCKSCSRKKAKMSNLKLYGKESYAETEEYKIRYKETCLERYGIENVLLSPEIQAKRVNTMNERYGSNCALQNESVAAKTKVTLLDKFGVDHYSKCDEFKDKTKDKWLSFYLKKLPEHYNITDFKVLDNYELEIKCTEGHDHYFKTTYKTIYQRHDLYNVALCTICNPVKRFISWAEQSICNILSEKYNIEQTNKTILNGKHIDIYLPDNKFGIEYNGMYWHSELYNEYDAHFNKSISCDENGIKLFQIFENDWKFDSEYVLKFINNYFGNSYLDLNNYELVSIKKNYFNLRVFNGKISKNNYVINDGEIRIGEISFSNDTITYFNYNPDYDANVIFKLFVDILKLKGFNYLHDINNVFLNTDDFSFNKYIRPDYKYFYYLNKHKSLELFNKHKINILYGNNRARIVENGYLRVFDCGYKHFNI